MLNRWLNTVSIDIDADADASPQLIDGLMNLCLPIHPLIVIFSLTFQFHACLDCLYTCILINCLLLVLWDFSKVLWQLYYTLAWTQTLDNTHSCDGRCDGKQCSCRNMKRPDIYQDVARNLFLWQRQGKYNVNCESHISTRPVSKWRMFWLLSYKQESA